MTKDKKIKELLNGVVDRILTEKKKEIMEKTKKLREQKEQENAQVQKIKESLHATLKDVKWDTMSLGDAKKLVVELKTWVDKVSK